MRFQIVIESGGEELGRQLVSERDLQNAASGGLYLALGAYRDANGQLKDVGEIVMRVIPRADLADAGAAKPGG